MNSRALASGSLTWSLILLQSSIAHHLPIGTHPIEPGAKELNNGEQVLHQLLLWRERIPIHNQSVRALPLAERSKPLEANAFEPVVVCQNEATRGSCVQ
jgi:hypothetical protein